MLPFRSALAALIVALALGAPALAQEIPNPDCSHLGEAQQRYDTGRFEAAIRLATGCLESPSGTEAQRQRAYRLVGLSYIGQDLRDDARTAVRQLVELVPNFEPDPINDPPLFIEMVEEARAELVPEEPEMPEEPEVEAPPVTEAPVEAAPEVPIVDPDRAAEWERRAREQEEQNRRAEEARRKSGGGAGKWLLIGGAVVGGGVLAAVLLGGGDDGDDDGIRIPVPPGPPGQ